LDSSKCQSTKGLMQNDSYLKGVEGG
jgi:hypothetical protein